MLKKIFISFFIILVSTNLAMAKDIEVKLRPVEKITTSNPKLVVGTNLNFIVDEDVYKKSKLFIKQGTNVSGIVTSIEDNDFLYKPATLYAENFETSDVNGKRVKLKGIIYKKGNEHEWITQFIPVAFVDLRGGEVQIKPKKDTFTLFVEE